MRLTMLVIMIHCGCFCFAGVRRSECFPVEKLPAEVRSKGEELLLAAMDSEGLYTIIGGLKPATWFFGPVLGAQPFRADQPDLHRVRELQQVFDSWQCGPDLEAQVWLTTRTRPDALRIPMPMLFHRPAIAEVIRNHRPFFEKLGLTEWSHPFAILATSDSELFSTRSGLLGTLATGYLLGYPDAAVEHFAVQGAKDNVKQLVGKGEPRQQTDRYIKIPVFSTAKWAEFTYNVPADHVENEQDRLLRTRAAGILAEYRKRRDQFIGAGKPGIVELLRDWFCSSGDECSPRKVQVRQFSE